MSTLIQTYQEPLSTPSPKPFPKDVSVPLNYLASQVQDTYYYIREPAPGQAPSNVSHEPHTVPVKDLRVASKSAALNLETSGFELFEDPSAREWFDYTLFNDDARVEAEYYPRIEALLRRKFPDAKEIVIFDHTIRRRDPTTEDQVGARQPVQAVHVDQSPAAARQRVRRYREKIGDARASDPRPNFQLINIWRPLFDDLEDSPLAFADFRSINYKPTTAPGELESLDAPRERGDLAASDLIYPEFRGQTFRVRYNPSHKWYYIPDQRTDEVTLLKCYDSRAEHDPESGIALFAPHTSFTNPLAGPTSRLRESIEIRTLIFF
ncbi:uncharacterized protein SAPINGB_P004604 [Magnusiomyces paraingens]|uniref:7alpha-cephem-methoxylase P8 chain related protein n=1 Tax=Magnusiomyces paraingens TaxID=2606893 RepID=A0A5E8BVH7_9ASCO|nr:uncharacterized protein SAPINGB_P004604 [Saprochaete ingens]VVT55453.1 unnamed protein product [Saprochaete ingens]